MSTREEGQRGDESKTTSHRLIDVIGGRPGPSRLRGHAGDRFEQAGRLFKRKLVKTGSRSGAAATEAGQASYVFSALHQVTLVPEGQGKIAGGKRVRERSPRLGGPMDFAPWKGAGRTARNQGQTKLGACGFLRRPCRALARSAVL